MLVAQHDVRFFLFVFVSALAVIATLEQQDALEIARHHSVTPMRVA